MNKNVEDLKSSLADKVESRTDAQMLGRELTVEEKAGLEDFAALMKNEVIPQIVADVQKRRELAHYSRIGILDILRTQQELHAAWRKRAEEAELALATAGSTERVLNAIVHYFDTKLGISYKATISDLVAERTDLLKVIGRALAGTDTDVTNPNFKQREI